jgi:hypothetical protein
MRASASKPEPSSDQTLAKGRTGLPFKMELSHYVFILVLLAMVLASSPTSIGPSSALLASPHALQQIPRGLIAARADKLSIFKSDKIILETTWINATLLKQELYVFPHHSY